MLFFLWDKALGHRGQSWTNAYFVIFTAAILDLKALNITFSGFTEN